MKNKKILFVLSVLGFLPLAAFAKSAQLAMPAPIVNGLPTGASGPSVGSLGTPTYTGTGCNVNNTSFTESPDHKAISFIFDSYAANAGQGTAGQNKSSDSKNCSIRLPINLPQGVRVAIKSAEYRGFISVPAGGSANFTARYSFKDSIGIVKISPTSSQNFAGPMTQTFDQQTAVTPATQYSGCGGSTTLTLNSWMTVNSNTHKDSAQAVVDSVDGNLDPQWAVNLNYEPCIPPAVVTTNSWINPALFKD